MYTQCPECQTAFRVTAEILQKAKGRVRCGGCGNAFSALDFLSEEMPRANPAKPATSSAMPSQLPSHDRKAADLAERSRALLESLNALAGDEDVRIEDTGVEWRVLDENDVDDPADDDPAAGDMRIADTGSMRWFVSNDDDDEIRYQDSAIVEQLDESAEMPAGAGNGSGDAGQASLDLTHDTSASGERRYDDNTPLPEDFDDEKDEAYTPPPQRRATDQDPVDTDFDKFQVDLELGSDEDWEDLLDEAEAVALRAAEDSAVEELILPHDDSADIQDGEPQSEEIVLQEEEDDDAPGTIPELAVETSINAPATDPEATDTGPDAEDDESPVPADIDTQFNLQALALGIDTTHNDKLALAVEDDGLDDDDETQSSEMVLDFADDAAEPDEDDSGIIEKLRESTGAFQQQIAAAQLALERGDTDDDPPVAAGGEAVAEASAPSGDEIPDEPADEEEAAKEPAHEGEEPAAVPVELRLLEDDAAAPEIGVAAGVATATLQADEDEAAELPGEPENDDATGDDLPVSPGEKVASISADIDHEPIDEAELSEEERLSQTMIRAGIDPAALHSDNVETIVMEGEFVRGSLDKERLAAESEIIASFDDADSLADTYMLNKSRGRRKSDPVGIGVIVTIVMLAVLLVAQYVHSSRESLAAFGAFNQTLGPVYRALGNPVTPEWNVKGWQFETTRGSTNEAGDLLTIFSTISNASGEPLPYPLVHVSLTDRWEEIIGSKVLEPANYLAGDLDPRKPVAPGDRISAVIAIDSPSPEATGFKLNVCYRVGPARVRCATEDFKN